MRDTRVSARYVERGVKGFVIAWVLWVLFCLACVIGFVVIVWHFVAKYW